MTPQPRKLVLRLPEGASFSYELAGLGSRFCAWFIDAAVLVTAFGLLEAVMATLALLNPDWGTALHILAFFALSNFYGILLEWGWQGQTIGKRLFRLRVMDLGGGRLGFVQAALRNLLRAADRLPLLYGLGGLAALLSRRGQRLGDLAAGSVVIREPRLLRPDWGQAEAGKFNSLRPHLRLCARLRQATRPREAELALRALLRREALDPAARVELFGRLAAHFKSKAEFPPEAVESVPDEQFIRNVADLLFESASGALLSPATAKMR